MKSSFSSLMLLIVAISIISHITSCKKDNNDAKKLIDEIVGTYIAYDTLRYSPQPSSCGGDAFNSYSFTITKQSETEVKISELGLCNDIDATVSESNITLLTSTCTSLSPSVSKTGTILYFTYSDFFMGTGVACNGSGTVKAVKQ